MFCTRLFICALWSPAGKGLTSWLSFVVSSVSLSLSHWYPGSGVVLDCIDSWSLQPYYFDSLALLGANWHIKFNVAKCYFMRVTWHYSHNQILHDYTLHQQTLENVQSTKYLGITITEIMDWGNLSLIFHPKQLRFLVFFAGTWLSHLGVLRMLHTKLWYALNWSVQHCRIYLEPI